jgi:ketosteroid isomerase-like protein
VTQHASDRIAGTDDEANNRAVIERFVAAWINREEADLLELLHGSVEWSPPQTVGAPVRDRAHVAQLLTGGAAGKFVRLETLQREVVKILVDGDDAVALIRLRAQTLKGDYYENDYAWYYHLAEGRVAKIVEYADTLHAARLGFLPLSIESSSAQIRNGPSQ